MAAVAIATSSSGTTTWDSIMGIVRQAPAPMPMTTWYPIHAPLGLCSFRSIRRPDPTAARTGPPIMKGMKWPVAVMVMPTAIWLNAERVSGTSAAANYVLT
jgi:hypothetical protein